MIIELKAIKNKINEWKPQDQIFFNKSIVEKIIVEEDLKNNMIYKQGVGFDASNQIFTNVVFDCDKYNGEAIFLVKTKSIVKDREYFFAYVSAKSWNTSKKVVLSLTIDTLTSNYDLFFAKKFKGKTYIERTNNYKMNINNFHSDVCLSLLNNKTILEETDLKIKKEIDAFFESGQNNIKKEIWVNDQKLHDVIYSGLGTILTDSTRKKVFGFSSVKQSFDKEFAGDNSLPNTIDYYLGISTNNKVKFEQPSWDMTSEQFEKFKINIQKFQKGFSGNTLAKIQDIVTDKTMKKWFTIPKIFDLGSSIFESFIINVPMKIKEIDLSNHLNLHKEYFLSFNNLFRIPLNLIKLEDKIYGRRIIKSDGIKFEFRYQDNFLDPFFEIDLPLQNDLLNDQYKKYKEDLELAYSSGIKGVNSSLVNIGSKVTQSSLSFIAGKGFGIFNLAANVASLPFELYNQYKQEKYEEQKVRSEPKESKILMLFDVFEKILYSNISFGDFGFIEWNDPSKGLVKYLIALNYSFVKTNKNDVFCLEINQPIDSEIEKINYDQKEFGNIVNKYFLNIDNILNNDDNSEKKHLYWQGKINPTFNPIDIFQFEVLNQTLAKGVYILNYQPQEPEYDDFDIEIISSTDDFNIEKKITDVTIESSENDLNIESNLEASQKDFEKVKAKVDYIKQKKEQAKENLNKINTKLEETNKKLEELAKVVKNEDVLKKKSIENEKGDKHGS